MLVCEVPATRRAARPEEARTGLDRAGQATGGLLHQAPGFATGVEAAADTTHRRVDGLLTWQEDSLRRVKEACASGLADRLAADIIGLPVFRSSGLPVFRSSGLPVLRPGQVADRYGVTHQAAMNALRRLEHLGLITAETTHGRVTVKADDVVQVLEQ